MGHWPVRLKARGFFSGVHPIDQPSGETVVVFMPGIREDGRWVNDLSEAWQDAAEIEKVSVGNRSFRQLLHRRNHAADVTEAQRQLFGIQQKYPGRRLTIVAHSYGTVLLADAIGAIDTVDMVVFMGSVLQPHDARRVKAKCRTLINQCGKRDIWVFMAAALRPEHYGCAGIFGFNRSIDARDQFFDISHGAFTKQRHLNDHVFPAVIHGRLESPKAGAYRIPHSWERWAAVHPLCVLLVLGWAFYYWPRYKLMDLLRWLRLMEG